MEMNLEAHTQTFLQVLDSQESTTGGGSASALSGAMAASLSAMVARLSIGKEGMQPEDFYRDLIHRLDALSAELLKGAVEDSRAFGTVRSAYQLPRQSPEEKEARSRAIQKAWVEAANVPLVNAEKCLQALQLSAALKGRSNPNAASDLACAGYLARAGLLGCLENVEINLPAIQDTAKVQALAAQVEEYRKRAQTAA